MMKWNCRNIELFDSCYRYGEIASPLSGKTIVLFFPESSIRTRLSFEKGIHMLGGNTILFPRSALDKREDIKNMMGYLKIGQIW